MKVNEIFYSIEGEGIRQGYPCVFVRFAGCNLNCSYCDTGYARHLSQGKEMSEQEIIDEILRYECPRVTLTGGEPLLSVTPDFLEALWDEGFDVNIETNGSVDPRPFMLSNTIITMDYKLPSSGMEDHMDPFFIDYLRIDDVLKFVVGTKQDVLRALEIMKDYPTVAEVFFSPVFGKMEPCVIANMLKEHHSEARVQLQLHKIIYDPETRGV